MAPDCGEWEAAKLIIINDKINKNLNIYGSVKPEASSKSPPYILLLYLPSFPFSSDTYAVMMIIETDLIPEMGTQDSHF